MCLLPALICPLKNDQAINPLIKGKIYTLAPLFLSFLPLTKKSTNEVRVRTPDFLSGGRLTIPIQKAGKSNFMKISIESAGNPQIFYSTSIVVLADCSIQVVAALAQNMLGLNCYQ